jgi:putative ABC transport system substrate-binding protein
VRRRDFITLIGGTAVARPFAARAQQKAMPVVGFLSVLSPAPNPAEAAPSFLRGLGETGYIDGQNVAFEWRWAEGHYDRLPALAADLVGRKVDLIAALGGPPALAAKSATSTIPIVFSVGVEPVEFGLVTSLARPGGNLTGNSIITGELTPKRCELLSELVPEAKVIALLVNPSNSNAERTIKDMQEVARVKGLQLDIMKAVVGREIDTAFATIVQLHAGALVVGDDPFFNVAGRDQLVALAARYRVPTIYPVRGFVTAGGLISYGANIASAFRQAGIYAGRILKGEKPANLPVQLPDKFELVINLKTAKELGMTIPQSILVRADEVIE